MYVILLLRVVEDFMDWQMQSRKLTFSINLITLEGKLLKSHDHIISQ